MTVPIGGTLVPAGPGFPIVNAGDIGGKFSQISFTPSAARNVIYVRSSGNDSTGNGTSGTPYRTIPRALLDVSTITRGTHWVIDITGLSDTISDHIRIPAIAAGVTYYNAYAAPDWPGFWAEGDITIQAIPQLSVTLDNGATQLVDPDTFNIKITDNTKSWTPGQWRGFLAVGNLAGDEVRTIIDSGTNYVICEGNTNDTTPLTGPIKLYDFGATLNGAAFIDVIDITDSFAGTFALNGVRVHGSNTAGTGMLCASSTCDLYLSCSYIKTFEGLSIGTLRGGQMAFETDLNLGGAGFANFTSGALINVNLSPVSTNLVFTGGAVGSTFPQANQATAQRILLLAAIDFIDSKLLCDNAIISLSHAKFTSSPGDAIEAGPGGLLQLGASVKDGGSNAGYGVRVNGGRVSCLAASMPTVTGASGNFKVGARPVRTWSDLLANAPIGLELDVFGGGGLLSTDTTTAAMPGIPAGFFDVTDYGAVGDGTTDDGPAFQAAFDAAKAARGGVVIAPACSSMYKIATPIVVNCSTTEAFCFTLLAVGKILIATGPNADAFEVSNSGTFIFDRATLVGNLSVTPPDTIDCRHMVVAAGQTNLLFRDCRILGVMASTTLAATALVQVAGTVRYERTVFGGCSASYVHETTALQKFSCDDLRFYDYWYADGIAYSKTPFGVSHWVHIETGAAAEPVTGAISQATIQIRNIATDEGAQNAIVIYGGSPSTKVDRVEIDGVTSLQANQTSSHVLYLDGIRRCTVRNVAVKTPADHDYIQALNIDSLVIEETTTNPAHPARIELGANIGSAILRDVDADSIFGTSSAMAVVENNGVKQLLPYATGSLPNPSTMRDGTTVLDTTVPAVAVVVGGVWKKSTLA